MSLNTYSEADALLGKRASKKLENNTYLVRSGPDTISVRLHNTHIITFDRNGGRVHLSTGGWNTVTTRDRLNRYMPAWAHLYSESEFLVLCIAPRGKAFDWRTAKRYLWGCDGLTLNPNRSVSGAGARKPEDAIREYKREQARERYAANAHKRRVKHMLTALAPGLMSQVSLGAVRYLRFQSWRGPLGEVQEVCSVNDVTHFIHDDGAYFAVLATPGHSADPLDMSSLVSALDAFIPEAVRADRSGWQRQGEFYFRPAVAASDPTAQSHEASINAPLIEYSRHLLTGERLVRKETVERWGQQVERETTAFVTGTITAPDHPTLTLDGWHEVAYVERAVD